jgi:hypothetical protein
MNDTELTKQLKLKSSPNEGQKPFFSLTKTLHKLSSQVKLKTKLGTSNNAYNAFQISLIKAYKADLRSAGMLNVVHLFSR